MARKTLITAPKHVVSIWNPVISTDDDGSSYISWESEPHIVRCNVHSMASDNLNRSSTTRENYFGEKPNDVYIITAAPGTWPGLPNARVLWEVSHRGKVLVRKKLIQRARVGLQRMSPNTAHDKIVCEVGNEIGWLDAS